MPDEDNTATQEVQDPFKGTKFEGKTPEEIASMYDNLESTLGRQGDELGQLRGTVARLAAEPKPEREPARKSEYTRYAEGLIVNPEETISEFGEEVERRAVERASRIVQDQMARTATVETFFRDNPELEKHRDIVSVIGEKIYQQNPNSSLADVLAQTKRASAEYISSLQERFGGRGKDADRKKAAITTSGGMVRETGGERDESSPGPALSDEQQSIMDEIKRMKDHRTKRAVAPRGRG